MRLSPAERQQRHRQKKYAEWASMPPVPCQCRCGTLIPPTNKNGLPAKFAHGHNGVGMPSHLKGRPAWNRGKPSPWAVETHKGKKLSEEEIQRRTATRLATNDGVYQTARGWKHAPETIAKMTEVNRAKALKGEDNPFFGKKHTPESRAAMSAKLAREKHPQWKGGIGTLPYGPEFTEKFKRLIRERDGNACRCCGKPHEEGRQAFPVHHLDRDKKNNDPINLVTLCYSCHRWADAHPELSLFS